VASWRGDDTGHNFSAFNIGNSIDRAGAVAVPRKARESIPRRVVRHIGVPEPRHILVSLLSPIGDTLLATPALAALRRR